MVECENRLMLITRVSVDACDHGVQLVDFPINLSDCDCFVADLDHCIASQKTSKDHVMNPGTLGENWLS